MDGSLCRVISTEGLHARIVANNDDLSKKILVQGDNRRVIH